MLPGVTYRIKRKSRGENSRVPPSYFFFMNKIFEIEIFIKTWIEHTKGKKSTPWGSVHILKWNFRKNGSRVIYRWDHLLYSYNRFVQYFFVIFSYHFPSHQPSYSILLSYLPLSHLHNFSTKLFVPIQFSLYQPKSFLFVFCTPINIKELIMGEAGKMFTWLNFKCKSR